MIEVNSKQDLKHALSSDENVIHVTGRNLCLGIITRPHKLRRILFAYQDKGYRLIKINYFGSFDVKFVRQDKVKSKM